MKQIQENVLQVIKSFVDKKECFTSLDVYCMLGIRFNDESYPIYEQVADAYRQGIMGQYQVEMTRISLEHGSSANVWRYYLPKSEKKEFTVPVHDSLVLTASILGHFPLLDINMELLFMKGTMIRLVPTTVPPSEELGHDPRFIKNTSNDIIIPSDMLREFDLYQDKLKVTVFQNKIEITK